MPVEGQGQLRLYNVMGCETTITSDAFDPILLKNLDSWENKTITVNGPTKEIQAQWTPCAKGVPPIKGTITIYNNQVGGLDISWQSWVPQISDSWTLVVHLEPSKLVKFIICSVFLSLFQATSYTFYNSEQPFQSLEENLDKSDNGDPTVMVVYNSLSNSPPWNANVSFINEDGGVGYTAAINSSSPAVPFSKVPAGNL